MDREKLQECIKHLQIAERLLEELKRDGQALPTLYVACDEIQTVKKQLMTKEERVAKQLRNMGMPAHLEGYHQLVKAIVLYSEKRYKLKELYQIIAGNANINYLKIDRSIRHAIEVSWERGDEEELFEIFGNSTSENRGKPSNREYIGRLAEMLNHEEI